MKDLAQDDTVIDRLRLALEQELLPRAARKHARQLMERLASPVRVTLLGMPGSGKTELVNMFFGRSIVPTTRKMPTMEIVWGEEPRIKVTDSDGSSVTHKGLDFDKVPAEAAYVRAELPVDLLQRISLLEVVTDGSAGEISAAVDWAVRRTDIALWCSQEFDEVEREAWRRVPETLKDHAFIVLTKADILSVERRLSDRIAELEAVVSEEFHSLFAIATLQAIRAVREDGTVDEALRHASGGEGLMQEILRHAERGRRADLDTADLFLARYQVGQLDTSADRTEATTSRQDATETAAETPPEALETEDQPQSEATPPPAPPVDLSVFREATGFLARRSEGLERTVADYAANGGPGRVVAQCADLVENLIDQFAADDRGGEAGDRLLDDLTEAGDMLMLIGSERGDGPAADAVTLLLQLKREMEDCLAA